MQEGKMKKILVCGAGGFIGGHLVSFLKSKGYWVRGVDLKYNEFNPVHKIADHFIKGDLRNPQIVYECLEDIDEVYQLAADMGGAGFVFTGENDADIMHNSALVNLNIAHYACIRKVKKIFYSSSACMYPEHNQIDSDNPNCEESSAYPANPDSEYGWEKLFSERLFLSYMRNKGIAIRIARYHNIFGPEGTWDGGREKAPAAICRKVAQCEEGGQIEIWGTGSQTRSFLYIDECLEATYRLMNSEFTGPVNIGSEEMVSINRLVEMVLDIANKKMEIKHIDGPLGVRGRTSDNKLLQSKLDWEYTMSLKTGLEKTYSWISDQINNQ